MKDNLKQVSFISTTYSNFKTQTITYDPSPQIVLKVQELMKQAVKLPQNKKTSKLYTMQKELMDDPVRLTPAALSSYRFRSLTTQKRMTNPEKLIIRNQNRNKEHNFKEIHKKLKQKQSIFGTQWLEYQQIFDFHNLLSPQSMDIHAAEQDLKFIKDKVQIIHELNKSANLERVKTKQKCSQYQDKDGVYWVQPNRPLSSRLIMKRELNS